MCVLPSRKIHIDRYMYKTFKSKIKCKVSKSATIMWSKLVYILVLIVVCRGFVANNLKLKQVFIFSRHNVRFPLFEGLRRYSLWPWLKLGPPGILTPRGALLEGYMGEYFSEWFKQEKFLPEGCPDEDTVYVYANALSRTKATARAFVDTAFKSCTVYLSGLTTYN